MPRHKRSNGVNVRRQSALERLEDRLKLDNTRLQETTKRFKNKESVDEKDFQAYRDFLKKEVAVLKTRIKN